MIRALFAVALVLLAVLLPRPLGAQDSMPPAPYAYNQLDDPRLEAEASALMHTLRCLKCQSQSIADSDAPMAGDMRRIIRERIAAGDDPDEVRAWLVSRYGDFVSFKPDVKPATLPLWLLPLAALLGGLWLAMRRLRWRKR